MLTISLAIDLPDALYNSLILSQLLEKDQNLKFWPFVSRQVKYF